MPSNWSFREAAEIVLAEAATPLTVDAITEEALRRGLIQPGGSTPVATMSGVLYVEARDNPNTRLVRLSEPGPNRARRGSVRWTLRDQVETGQGRSRQSTPKPGKGALLKR